MRINAALLRFMETYQFKSPKDIAPQFLLSDRMYNKCIRTMTLSKWRLLILKIENDESMEKARGYDFLTKVLCDLFYVQNAKIVLYWKLFNWSCFNRGILFPVNKQDVNRGPPVSYVYDRIYGRYKNATHRRRRCASKWCTDEVKENRPIGVLHQSGCIDWEEPNQSIEYKLATYEKQTPLNVDPSFMYSYHWLCVCDRLRRSRKPVLGQCTADWEQDCEVVRELGWDGDGDYPQWTCHMHKDYNETKWK